MIIGYARVSTKDQNLELQTSALKSAGCEQIFTDTMSGAKAKRPGLDQALELLAEGDTLIVWKLDRLGRSMANLIELVQQLNTRKVNFRSITDQIDTATPMGRFVLHIMGALAEMERELILERTQAGLEAAKRKGVKLGPRRKVTQDKIEAARILLYSGKTVAEAAKQLGLGRSSLYSHLKTHGNAL